MEEKRQIKQSRPEKLHNLILENRKKQNFSGMTSHISNKRTAAPGVTEAAWGYKYIFIVG